MKDEIQKSEKSEQIKQLKKTLEQCLKTVNWTQKELAEKIADEKIRKILSSEYMTEDEISEFKRKNIIKEYNNLRQHLKRDSTKPETLRKYIDFIIDHREFKLKKKILRLPELNLSLLSLENSDQEILEEISKISDEVFSENKK